MKKIQKKIKFLFITVIIICLSFTLSLGWLWWQLTHKPLLAPHSSAVIIRVPTGTGIENLAYQLHQQQLLAYPRFFIFYSALHGYKPIFKRGEYRINPQATASDLLLDIANGKVIQRRITFIEGWTFERFKQTLRKNPYITHELTHLSDAAIMLQLGDSKRLPEGLFFPDTYFFVWGDSDLSILKKSYYHMQEILQKNWHKRAADLPLQSSYDALIIASLIERETALATERPIIAGVIYQRLKIGMRLQIDPTILYGLSKSFGSRITKQDLVTDTPYNTYLHKGLPPTPIGMPGRASIIAALHPASVPWLYYVAKGNGGHVFSTTYTEHKRAIVDYRAFIKSAALNNEEILKNNEKNNCELFYDYYFLSCLNNYFVQHSFSVFKFLQPLCVIPLNCVGSQYD